MLVWLIRPKFDGGLLLGIGLAFAPVAGVLSTIARWFFPPTLEMEANGLSGFLHEDKHTDQ